MPFTLVGTHALHKFLALVRMHTCQQREWSGLVLFSAASHCCFNSVSQAEAVPLSSRAQRSRHTFHAVTCRSPTPAITHSLKLNTCLAVGGHADTTQADCVMVA